MALSILASEGACRARLTASHLFIDEHPMSRSHLAIVFLLMNPCTMRAEIAPSWTTPNNSMVTVPVGGSSPFQAAGNVSIFFDAMLVVDTSGSMNTNTGQTAPNGGTRRGDWVLAGADGLVDVLHDDIRLGLVDFDLDSLLVAPLAPLGPPDAVPSHRQALKTALRSLGPGRRNRFCASDRLRCGVFGECAGRRQLEALGRRERR